MACRWSIQDLPLRTAVLRSPERYPSFAVGIPGTVYPFPELNRLSASETEVVFQAVVLENDHVEVVVLPGLGGRIFRIRTRPAGQDLLAVDDPLRPILWPGCGAWLPGGLQIDRDQPRSARGLWPVAWRVVEEPETLTLWLAPSSCRGLQYSTSITLNDTSTGIRISEHLHNPTPAPLPALFWSRAAVRADPSARLQSGMSPVGKDAAGKDTADISQREGIAWTSIYHDRASAGVVRLTGCSPDPDSSNWMCKVIEAPWPSVTAACELESTPEPDKPFATLAPRARATWTELWTPVEATGGCLGAAAGLLFNLQRMAAPAPDTAAGELQAERRVRFEDRADDDAAESAGLCLAVYATVPVRDARVKVLSPSGCLLDRTFSLQTGETQTVELENACAGDAADLTLALEGSDSAVVAWPFLRPEADRLPAPVPDDLSENRVGLRQRCADAISALRGHSGDEELGVVRQLVAEAPLDPVVRWMERKWLADECSKVHQPLRSPAVTYPDDGQAAPDGDPLPPPPGLDPNLSWLLEAGAALEELGMTEARDPLHEAARGGHPLAAYRLAHLLAQSGDDKEARLWIEKAGPMRCDYILPRDRTDLTALQTAKRLMPGDAAVSFYLGLGLLAQGDVLEARMHLRSAQVAGWEQFAFAPVLLWASAHCAMSLLPEESDKSTREPPGASAQKRLSEAIPLLETAIGLAPRDALLYLQRDRLAAARGDSADERLTLLRAAAREVRSDARIAIRLAALLNVSGELDESIRLLNVTVVDSGSGDERDGAHSVHVEARVGRAIQRCRAGEYESALEDLEAALDYPAHLGARPLTLPCRTELLWWAGVCCDRLGRGFQARGYWQAAIAERQPASSLPGVCRALAMASLGGAEQAHTLLGDAIAEAGMAPESRGLDLNGDRVSPLSSDTEQVLAAALARYALGDRAGALRQLEWLPIRAPEFPRGAWYFAAAGSGLLDLR